MSGLTRSIVKELKILCICLCSGAHVSDVYDVWWCQLKQGTRSKEVGLQSPAGIEREPCDGIYIFPMNQKLSLHHEKVSVWWTQPKFRANEITKLNKAVRDEPSVITFSSRQRASTLDASLTDHSGGDSDVIKRPITTNVTYRIRVGS